MREVELRRAHASEESLGVPGGVTRLSRRGLCISEIHPHRVSPCFSRGSLKQCSLAMTGLVCWCGTWLCSTLRE